ncbi:cyclin-dependent kinase inhibitor 5-like [Wolffia australiana]
MHSPHFFDQGVEIGHFILFSTSSRQSRVSLWSRDRPVHLVLLLISKVSSPPSESRSASSSCSPPHLDRLSLSSESRSASSSCSSPHLDSLESLFILFQPMGKYFKKGNVAEDVAVMEVSLQSSLGVRTRARTLALQGLQRSSSPSPSPTVKAENSDACYLRLRNRRLEKSSPVVTKACAKTSTECNEERAEKPTCSATVANSFSRELEAFFTAAEQIQQKILLDRYNFDPVNDRPLPGRYYWVRLDLS